MRDVVVDIDVTEAAGLGESLHTRVTVTLPDASALADPPVACFAFPGGGYSRGYFALDVPDANADATLGGQAAWHAQRGWAFVAVDHLCVGESAMPADPSLATFEIMAAANAATVERVTELLSTGALDASFPAMNGLTRIGIGQSMGGCLLVVQQGRHATFDGVGILGYSAIHTVLPMPPGTPAFQMDYLPRGTRLAFDASQARAQEVTQAANAAENEVPPTAADLPITTWGFHMDDEPQDMVIADMVDYPLRSRSRPFPQWGSMTIPPCAASMLSPGAVAPEAATITAPVLVAVGERDVVPDPRFEPKAYQRSSDITVVVVPDMAHMHNFASTRVQLWSRLHEWAEGIARSR
ncbi:MAG: hypothetical protein Q7V88_17930 [Actinomycetota bacterium]|nr:hypothetical protein [Actinomycetota bacterium]